MRARVEMDPAAAARAVEPAGRAGAQAAAELMAREQRRMVRSRRVAEAIEAESGRDMFGWWARAGVPRGVGRTAAFIWIFHEFQVGSGPPGQPFIRPSLQNNSAAVVRAFTRGAAL